jgi:hypothetical protein
MRAQNKVRRQDTPWFWSLEFHEWQGSDGPQYGNVADLEAAKARAGRRGSGAPWREADRSSHAILERNTGPNVSKECSHKDVS